ncbi:uncharacterized protein V6R79_018870 [Siganus canaliculatus]
MEDEERQKKLEAGKAKLAEYRQRKAHADSQKKQKKKKKKKPTEDSEGDSQGRVEVEPDQSVGGEEGSGGGRDGSQEGDKHPPTTEFNFSKTLRSGEVVKHDQTYTIEPESEVSTTAEDCSSEVNGCLDEMTENLMMPSKDFIWEEVEPLPQVTEESGSLPDMEDALAAKTQAVEELSKELEEIRAAFGSEGVQQLQDFEAALKQRDGIITQLTANLQQAREEKDEIMKEFLELTEQSQKLQIQFQQLQAGETLRNTSHSSTAADLLLARQQLTQYQQQLDELNVEVRRHRDISSGQLEDISKLQLQLSEAELSGRRSEESLMQRINEKDLLIADREKLILSQEQSLKQSRLAEESFAQTLKEKNQLISEQTAIITEHELSLTMLREELVHVGRTPDTNIMHETQEKDLIIAEQERVISERDCSLTQVEDELESSEKRQHELQQRMLAKESELEKCMDELESTKSELERCHGEMESVKLEMEKQRVDLESCKSELMTSRQKERMSSSEIMQLMGTVEDLQKRCHQGSLSESDTVQKMQEESVRKLELLRAELDEMYGQQIVQMKQELNLQHVARVEQMTEQHRAELELLKGQLSQSSTIEVNALKTQIRELQETLEQSQVMHNKAQDELSQVTQEKFNLQEKVEDLLQDLRSAKEQVEQVSHSLLSQESQQGELQRLQETIDNLKQELADAQEVAEEAEAKHESEITNYKIKLEMLEREKDAVLDRMAESQEAELERLRTQLLFSHEEELTSLREELQKESFLNAENLLNEATVKHQAALDQLRFGYEEKLQLLQREKATFANERDELVHQILGLKEDLKLALHSSKADKLVQQLQELQVELEELRKGGEERVRVEKELKALLKKMEVLENESREKEQKLKEQQLENETLIESTNSLKDELHLKVTKIETLTVENDQMLQQVAELKEEIEKQRSTFSFAEKNFEVNYQELKEEYTCLIQAKTQLEERTLKETLDFEAKIISLQSHIRELEESSGDIKMEDANADRSERAVIEKDTTELMEKLNVTLSEKESLAGRLSEVTEQLMSRESKVVQLEEELMITRQENAKVIARNESLEKELEKKQEIRREPEKGQRAQRKLQHQEQTVEPVASFEDQHIQIQSLQEEIKALQSLLQAAESERDSIRQTLELQQLSQTAQPAAAEATTAAAAQTSGEEPVEGRSSPQKSTASGSSRRKRRQRSKQERKLSSALSDCREERQREEEEGATSAAELEPQTGMESQVMSCSQDGAGKEDSTDGCQGDGGRDYINKRVRGQGSDRRSELVVTPGADDEMETTEHGECRLQLQAQRISMSQIHTAQLELLQEETDARTHTLELKLQNLRDHGDQNEPRVLKYHNITQTVSRECTEIIQCFKKMFGEGFVESVDGEGRPTTSVERPETSEFTSIVSEARDLYSHLLHVRETIEQEHHRLSQLQDRLRADGNKMLELQTAYDELRSSSEKEISDLRVQVTSLSSSTVKGLDEQAGAPSTFLSEEVQRLKANEQEKQRRLEESHRQEVELLRAHYQQQAADTEERYLTEIFMLQQRLQEVAGAQTHFSVAESGPETTEEHSEELLKELSDEGLSSEGGVESRRPGRFAGLTSQLQALRKSLYLKYVQEVAALKEQHSRELRKLREERESEWKREERRRKEQDLNGVHSTGSSFESLGAAGPVLLEERSNWERVEEEVARAIVQMSVEFAKQTELARINKRASQRCSSMQTQSDEDKMEEWEREDLTPRASLCSGGWLEEVEKERLERQLEERNVEIRKLKEELLKTGSRSEQALKNREAGGEQDEEEEDPGGVGVKTPDGGSLQGDRDSSGQDTDRDVLHKANKKLSQVLVEVLKTTAAAEETMGLHLQSLSVSSGVQQAAESQSSTQSAAWQSVNTEHFRPHAAGHAAVSGRGSESSAHDPRLWCRETEADEGLDVSQMMESLLLGAGTQLENEEYLMGISGRLQTALEKMLMTISDTTSQLEHARMTQTELMRESFRHNQEINELLQKQEELQERLTEEARAREQLALELHRAEGLIDGYTGERAALDEQLRQKEELQLSLEQELQVTSSRLHELEQERLQMQEERELLSRQQDAMKEHAGPRELRLVEAALVAAPEADLLEETEKLMKEKVEVQRQAEKENTDLLKQVRLLEAELEEQVNKVIELDHARRVETGDLQQQIQALEKQLEKNRKFLDEQAVDREHERDFFQQEIQKLEEQLKNPQKLQSSSEQRNQEVDQLTSQLKEKADWCSELLLSSEQLRRELGERDEEIYKLESRIRELEQALLASADSLEKVEQKKQHASITEAKHSTLESQLQTEREALERKEKEICNLEEQLEQFREELENKSEEVQQLNMQLEIQRKEISSQQEYLETRDSMLQEINGRDELIKDLESQVECLRSEQERLKKGNEEEVDQLNAVIEKLQQELANIEQKQAAEDDEDTKAGSEGSAWGPSQEEYDEMKQKMDTVTKELDTLKSEHGKLLETYLRLKESAVALAETEKLESSEAELEEALREKTAGLVVMQAQVQALEQSATSRVEELGVRVRELEDTVDEKDVEIRRCRLLLEQTQSNAEGLQQKMSDLERNLREKVAALLVSQATLEAFQQQQVQGSRENQDQQRLAEKPKAEPLVQDFDNFGIPQMDFSGIGQAKQTPAVKVVHLTEKLRELEAGLSGMQKDQELQKQLLSSSEEEVLEYERRLSVLMDLLNQMKTRTHQRTSPSEGDSSSDEQPTTSDVLQQLQEVRDEASATKEQLDHYQESCSRLQEELREKEITVEKLQVQLQEVSSRGSVETKVSELQGELAAAQSEAAAAKEELNSCKESLEKLQELLQEREMTIAQLKGELYQVQTKEDNQGNVADLLQEVRDEAASTKEELDSCRQRNEKLQEDLQVREVSISKLKEELQEVRQNVDKTKEEVNSYRQHNEKLQEELHVREVSISKLKDELQELRTALVKSAESGPSPPSPSPSPSPQPVSSASSSTATQPKRKGGKQPAAKGSSTKDKPSVTRKNSAASSQSSNRSHSSRPSNSSEQQHVVMTHSFTQTEPLQMSDLSPETKSPTKKEIEEVIGEFQEKIEQMQELHAAEILDMEARHISESESLRRDTQALEDECKALKAVIDKLRSAEASSRQDRPQFKDGYTSDSSSDYSQRTGFDVPSLQQEFRTTPEGARRDNDDALPDRIKSLLREVHQEGMQVLSLTELPFSEGDPGGQFNIPGWMKERDALLETVESLKGLITQMQTHRGAQTPGSADWQAQLLDAVRQVFLRERGVLKSALYSQLDLLDTNDAIVHLNQLERRLAEQDAQHREAMASLHTADRSSLISEIHQLRAQMEQIHQGSPPAASFSAEHVVTEQREGGGADGAADADRLLVEELKGELSQTKLELETTLKAQHKHLKELDTLRAEVSQKAAEVDALNDELIDEKKRSRDLQWAVEKERCRTGRNEDSRKEELEDLHLAVEEQKSHVAQLTLTLDQERQATSQLSQQSEQERLSLHRRLQELQVQLETERAKALEMSTALGRERELRTGAPSDHCSTQEVESDRRRPEEEESLLERLQRELDDKHAQVVHLLSEVEAQKLEVVRKEEELTLNSQRSRRDQEALLEAQTQLERLEAQMSDAQAQLERETEKRKSLEEERGRLEQSLNQFKERTGGKEGSGSLQADSHAQAAGLGESPDRTKDWVFQQKSPHLDVSPTGLGSGLHHGPWRTVDKVLGKLQLISSKIRGMVSQTTTRPTAEVDSEELSWVQSNVDEVITMLQQSPGLPSFPESVSLLAGGSSSSSNSLTERLLRQNAELTGFVSRLTEEKNDLRNHTLRLEEELRRYRQAGLGSGDTFSSRRAVSKLDTSTMLLSQEREAWTREKIRLEKALQLAQAQVARLKGEIRTDALREIAGPEADNAALKRMYGKYLRSESFRKALIYQKKYLLLLLGGFQECEEATLTLLARMGSRPTLSSLESLSQRRRGLMRFRSAVRVSIALSRMRFLVKRWHKATGMSSITSCTIKNGAGQTLGSDARDSPYLQPGSVEMYRDRGSGGGGGGGGVSSSRGRSGRESPRSAVSSTHHRFHIAGDHGALTCSHLQSYDPDRALTDYISRLEALQRRLGSVTSGASSYAQLHFGLRR